MLDGLIRFKNGLARALERLIAVMAGLLVIDVVWQVASRFIVRRPSSFTEEVASILLIWVSLLGAAAAYERGSHLGVDILVIRFGPAAQRRVQAFIAVCALAFAGLILLGGGGSIVEVTLKYHQITPALGIPRGLVYLALPVSGLCLAVFAVIRLAETIRGTPSAPAASGEGPVL